MAKTVQLHIRIEDIDEADAAILINDAVSSMLYNQRVSRGGHSIYPDFRGSPADRGPGQGLRISVINADSGVPWVDYWSTAQQTQCKVRHPVPAP